MSKKFKFNKFDVVRVVWNDATADEATTIIKNEDGSFSAKVICELCKCNVQDGDIRRNFSLPVQHTSTLGVF